MPQLCESLTNTATNLQNQLQTNTLATHEQYFRHYISLDFCSLLLIAKFWQEINKRNKCASNFLKEQCFEKKCFDNKTWKDYSSVMDRPMLLNMSKTFCHLGRLGTWNLMDIFQSSCWVTLFHTDYFVQGSGKNNTATSVCDILKLYVKQHVSPTNFR